jgi:DNA-binding response OmpR family regulator
MAQVSTDTPTVLIADPDRTYQAQLADCLRPRYHIVTANTLAETVEQIIRQPPAILLLELDFPDGDGAKLIEQIRENARTRQMVVCCVTKRSSIHDKVSGFQAGADDYVVKPVNAKTFMWRVVLLSRLR